MDMWNVTASKELIAGLAKLANSNDSNKNSFATNNNSGFSSDYAKILSQKIAQVEGNFKTAIESLSQQSQISVNANSMPVIETIKRFRPDGSITITTYKDGEIDSTQKIRPHLVPMPDYSAPPTPEGKTEVKYEKRFTAAELLLLML